MAFFMVINLSALWFNLLFQVPEDVKHALITFTYLPKFVFYARTVEK